MPRAHGTVCARARPLLGTVVEIVARGANAETAVERAFRAVAEVHRLMSYHDPRSDVSRINREAAFGEVSVSERTWRVLQAAQAFAEQSNGLFDVTIAPALAALGLLPRHADFPRASGHGHWRHVELRAPNRVRLSRRVRIDLGGIAKGYAVDRALQTLQSHAVCAARVNAGGDLRVIGARPQIVRVRRPDAPPALWPRLRMRTGAAATSADYFSSRRRHGRRVVPIVHPGTHAICAAGRSVTVLAADCLTADALTKVVYADPERSVTMLGAHGARGLLLETKSGTSHAWVFDAALDDRWLPAAEATRG
jgi:thiamine biosynthesis lipoprotein